MNDHHQHASTATTTTTQRIATTTTTTQHIAATSIRQRPLPSLDGSPPLLPPLPFDILPPTCVDGHHHHHHHHLTRCYSDNDNDDNSGKRPYQNERMAIATMTQQRQRFCFSYQHSFLYHLSLIFFNAFAMIVFVNCYAIDTSIKQGLGRRSRHFPSILRDVIISAHRYHLRPCDSSPLMLPEMV